MTHLANANGLAREQTIITMARALRARTIVIGDVRSAGLIADAQVAA